MTTNQKGKYQLPAALVKYLMSGLKVSEAMVATEHELRKMSMTVEKVSGEERSEKKLHMLAEQLCGENASAAKFCNSIVVGSGAIDHQKLEQLRQKLLKDYDGCVFGDRTPGSPSIRGPFGEAKIHLKPGAVPVKQRMCQIQGERR